MFYDQSEFDVRCEWGERGVCALAPISDVVVIVDVLSFSTCVDVATARGAIVYPYRWRDFSSAAFAQARGAVLAGSRGTPGALSLSPVSLAGIGRGTRLVLPSPNGSTLSFATGQTPTLCGCLRNCQAVAAAAGRFGPRVAVIPAGERWDDDSLRPAVEDWIGTGAIIAHLSGTRSPEAQAAVAAFDGAAGDLAGRLRACSSGRQLVERGFDADVAMAAEVNSSRSSPLLQDGAYLNCTAQTEAT